MNITRDDVKQGIMLIDLSYPNFLKDRDKSQKTMLINIWYELFKDTDKEVFMEAVKQTLLKTKYLPTIADVKDNIDLLIYGEFKPLETWNKSLKDMSTLYNCWNSWYDKDYIEIRTKFYETWKNLDPTIKALFGKGSIVAELYGAGEYEFNQAKLQYIKDAPAMEREFRANPKLRELVMASNKPLQLDEMRKEVLQLTSEETLKLGE